ncbi:MAG: Bax inhibitor-1/YccA family protein [Erysipelotrichaceae bacterium]|nr:Bax inhibitor-1/YccA family protein [Erysipelotrichaceae bacterium]
MKNEFLAKVFRWFGIGLLVTFIVAYFTSTNLTLINFVFSGAYWVIFLLELGLAIWLGARIRNMSSGLAKGLYLGYSALTGLTFSSIFIVYEIESIIWIFLASAFVFIIFSLIGKNTQIDLSRYGIYLFVLLLGSIILEVVNIFLLSQTLDMILCVVILGIFVSYVAYDIQKILQRYEDSDNMAIYGAFDLYLDFINIFLRLLRLFGKERD